MLQAVALQVLLWQHMSDKRPSNKLAFTYSLRFFWCYQILDILSEDINGKINLYKTGFASKIGKELDIVIWHGHDISPSRHFRWQRRIEPVKKGIEIEIVKLKKLEKRNREKLEQIRACEMTFSITNLEELTSLRFQI